MTLKMKEGFEHFYMEMFGEEPVVITVDNCKKSGRNCVAAGDPAIGLAPVKRPDEQIPLKIPIDSNSEISLSEYDVFDVFGTSMSPEEIDNGDRLLCKEVTLEEASAMQKGVFAVIAVDPEYYKKKNKHLQYDFKLRHTLYNMPIGTSIEDLIISLKGVTSSIILPKNQTLLRTKYEETVGFYQDRHLMLSLTYKEGSLRYSFHPVDLIRYKADYVLKHNAAGWYVKKL